MKAQSRERVRKALEAFINTGTLDGTQMSEHWFPAIHADVFISHSHDDEETALKFAGWLNNQFGLIPFIDSCVWGHSDDLLWEIDCKFCRPSGQESFSYEKRNGSTGHVHMMLASAISQMIDKTECVVFVNTPESITTREFTTKTYSPWIYYELAMLRMIRRRAAEDHRPLIKEANFSAKEAMDEALQIEYDVDLDSLTKIDTDTLNSWNRKWTMKEFGRKHPLDYLYKLAPE